MKNLFLSTLLLVLTGALLSAQTRPTHTLYSSVDSISQDTAQQVVAIDTMELDTLFKGTFYNTEIGLNIHLDLQEESLSIPGMSFLGRVHGYMDGKIYGVWILLKHEVQGNKAILRFTNDIGADTQNVILTANPDGSFYYETANGNNVRRAEGRKLVKIIGAMPMKKK